MNLQISYREILALARKQIKGVTIEDLKYVDKDTIHVSVIKKLLFLPLSASKNIRVLEVYKDIVIVEVVDAGWLLEYFGCLFKNDIAVIEGKKLTLNLRKIEKLAATFDYLGLQEITFNESGVSVSAEAI